MPIRYVARKLKSFVLYRILGLDDTPHRIALGVAIGIFITWMPLIGFQMVLILFLSTVLRANRLVGVPLAWITNPATLWIYIPNYYVGCAVVGARYDVATLWRGLVRAFGVEGGLSQRFAGLGEALWQVFWPLWWGSMIVAGVLAVAAYLTTYRGVLAYRRHRARQAARAAGTQAPAGAGPATPAAPS